MGFRFTKVQPLRQESHDTVARESVEVDNFVSSSSTRLSKPAFLRQIPFFVVVYLVEPFLMNHYFEYNLM